MTKTIARSIATIVIFCAGVVTILLQQRNYLPDTFASIILAVLIVAAVTSYFVIGRASKDNETTQTDPKQRTGEPS